MKLFILNLFVDIWNLVGEMAPYLLLGFLISGVLHVLIRPDWIKTVLGNSSFKTVFKACLIGIPLPLCSCSVIPVTASLSKSGASRGATVAFLTSTPQTGVDSFMATYGLMGQWFAFLRVTIALISGILTGVLINLFCSGIENSDDKSKYTLKKQKSCCKNSSTDLQTESNLLTSKELDLNEKNINTYEFSFKSILKIGLLRKAFRYGFLSLGKDIAKPLLFGFLIAGLISNISPSDSLSEIIMENYYMFPLITLISFPLYICSTASIPMAFSLVDVGFSPGSVLIFLIIGPATNTATLVTALKLIGSKATLLYVTTLLCVSWLAALAFDKWIKINSVAPMHECSDQPDLINQISALILVIVLIYAYLKDFYKKTPNN